MSNESFKLGEKVVVFHRGDTEAKIGAIYSGEIHHNARASWYSFKIDLGEDKFTYANSWQMYEPSELVNGEIKPKYPNHWDPNPVTPEETHVMLELVRTKLLELIEAES